MTEHCRAAARYLSKYVGKAFDAGGRGRVRLGTAEVGQGFQPAKVERLTFDSDSTPHGCGPSEQMGGEDPVVRLAQLGRYEDWMGQRVEVAFWSR